MTRRILLLAGVLLGGCGGGDTVVRGTFRPDALPEGAAPLAVWVEEGAEPTPVREGRFEIAEAPPGPLLLRIGEGDDVRARMELRDLPAGAELELEGIRIDRGSGLAFPSTVRLEGAETVLVNGLRLAPPGALPERVEEEGLALAVAGEGEALLFRPANTRLPDLRVVVTPGTEVVTPDGDPVRAERLEDGDSLRVQGTTTSGVVVATRLVVPRLLAVRRAAGPGRERDGGGSRERERAEARGHEPDRREEARGRGEERGKGRGKGKGKGKKGKG